MIEKNGFIEIEKGDTLGAVAKHLGKSTREIMALNPMLKDPNKIRVGQVLKTSLKTPKPSMPKRVTQPASPPAKVTAQEEAKPTLTKKEQAARSIDNTPNEPVSTEASSKCCCLFKALSVTQPKRGGKEGSYHFDIVKIEETQNTATPNNKKKSIYELYVTTPPFKDDGKPDSKKLTFAHTFVEAPCKRTLTLQNASWKKLIEGSVEIDSYGEIKGAFPLHKEGSTHLSANRKADEERKREWNLTKILKLVTAQEGLYEAYDLIGSGSNKCQKRATLHIAKPFKLDGEAKFSYTGEHDVLNTGKLSEWEAKAKSQLESKLTLTLGDDTIEFADTYTSGMSVPKGKRGNITTVPTKELFGNFAKYLDPVYAIADAVKEAPTSIEDATKKLKKILKEEFGSLGSIDNHKKKSTLGKTSFSLKFSDFTYSEVPKKYTIEPTGSLELGINVFDGASITLDLIPAITRSIDALKEVVSIATANTIDGDIKADLTLSGGVSGACKFEAKAGKIEIDKSLSLSGTLTATLDARIEAQAKWLYFETKAGAHATIASAKSINDGAGIKGEMTFAPPKTKDQSVDFSGDIICTGMAIYLGIYAEIKDDVYTIRET